MVVSIQLIDSFQQSETGRKSLCHRLTFQSCDKALSRQEVAGMQLLFRKEKNQRLRRAPEGKGSGTRLGKGRAGVGTAFVGSVCGRLGAGVGHRLQGVCERRGEGWGSGAVPGEARSAIAAGGAEVQRPPRAARSPEQQRALRTRPCREHRSTNSQLVVEQTEEASIVWHCEARASEKRSGRSPGDRSGGKKGTLGKGTSLSPGLWSHKGVASTYGALAGFVLEDDLPVTRAWAFAFVGLLPCCPMVRLPGESGNPVRRVRATVSAPGGEVELLKT
ncbi:uncharacterized protein LOC128141200 [Harpia harpyja]|uniref:uncharacterized protein LOC128141200 n=1 Tax=Harpia harpyja TaxID=202280 RepID=UPI0022B15B18|nr:uncharacterized protein LOC128141200 [Harpia harpyja]